MKGRLVLSAVLCIGLASAARYQLIEPVAMGALCTETPSDDWRCTLRGLVIALFAQQVLAWSALALSLLSHLVLAASSDRWTARVASVFASTAWCAGCVGLVLYGAELSAPAVLLAGSALWRIASNDENAITNHNAASAKA
jgi:hypothetical protein